MEKWLPTILTLAATGGSLIFLIISMRIKNAVQESTDKIVAPLAKLVGKAQDKVGELENRLVSQAGTCQGKYLSREDYDRLERLREQNLQLMLRETDNLQKLLREALKSIRSGQG